MSYAACRTLHVVRRISYDVGALQHCIPTADLMDQRRVNYTIVNEPNIFIHPTYDMFAVVGRNALFYINILYIVHIMRVVYSIVFTIYCIPFSIYRIIYIGQNISYTIYCKSVFIHKQSIFGFIQCFTVRYTVFHYTIYSVLRTIYLVLRTICSVLRTVYIVHCTVYLRYCMSYILHH